MKQIGLLVMLALAQMLALPPGAGADPLPNPQISPPDSWVPKDGATLRVLNKIDQTVQLLTLKNGAPLHYETLTLRVAGCFVRPDDLPADATAHLAVTEDAAPAPLFDGWILQREPALNLVQHPVYDISLAGCG